MSGTEVDSLNISDSYRSQLNSWHKLADLLFNKMRFFGSRKLYRNLSAMVLPKLQGKIFSPTIFGFDIVVGPDTAHNYYYLGFYEIGALNIFKAFLKPGDVFIDVGAQVGLMAFYTAQLVGDKGKVLAFEPTAKYFPDMKTGMEKNGIKNVMALKLALGSSKGNFPIYLNTECPSLVKTSDNDPFEVIEVDTLDAVLQQNNINKVKLIKIDVEGFELEVVKGAKGTFSSPGAPAICIEYIRDQQKVTENGMIALDLLKTFNAYRYFQLEQNSDTIGKLVEVKDFKDLHDNDNVFCLLEAHIADLKKSALI